MLKLVEKVH